MKKNTFSEKVKKEICELVYEDHCLKALLSSFVTNKLTVILKQKELIWCLNSQFPFIIDFIEKTFKNLYNVQTQKNIAMNATNINGQTNYLYIKGNFEQIENDLSLNEHWDSKNICSLQCCQRAYVTGAFLAGGSINSLESKSYHLEIRSNNYKYLLYQQALLAKFGIFPVLTKHTNKQYILYLKKVNQISDFLKLINVGNCMLEFEDMKISKDANMSITRWNNLDISNLNKMAVTGVKEVKQIKSIMNLPIYKQQSIKFKKFCELRLANESASLTEMVLLFKKKYNITISKSGLNHIVRKLDKMYNLNIKE